MKKKKYLFAVIFIMPAFILYTIFIVAPVFFSTYYSFTSWDGIGMPKNEWNTELYKNVFNERLLEGAA